MTEAKDPRAEAAAKPEVKKEAKAEDMTPVPTQEQLDTAMVSGGGTPPKSEKKRDVKPPEELPPTPTQAELDEYKEKLMPGGGETKEKKGEKKEVAGRDTGQQTEPPTPNQMEHDLIKVAAMNLGTPPEGSTDPQKRKELEASKPATGYATRAATPAPAKE